MYDESEKAKLIVIGISQAVQIPIYLLLAYSLSNVLFGNTDKFWYVLGIFAIVWVITGIVASIGGSVAWHLYSKKRLVLSCLQYLQEHEFPLRKNADHNDFLTYLARISSKIDRPGHADSVINAANDIERSLLALDGMIHSMRVLAAWRAAFDQYSPPIQAEGIENN